MHFDWRSFLDWISLASAVGTVLAAGLAAWAIKQSSRQAEANTALVVEERRMDVQLDALQRLADVVASPHYNGEQDEQRRLHASLQLAIIEAPIPTCRARFGSRHLAAVERALGLPEGTGWGQFDTYPDADGVPVADRMVGEIASAVQSLVAGRANRQSQISPQTGHSR